MDPILGQIQLFGFNFAPVDWMQCNGQVLPVNQYQALFALLGNTFGGNGNTTFGLPDLQGRVAVGMGAGVGLPTINFGEKGGAASVNMTIQQLPAHNHPVIVNYTQPSVNVSVGASSAPATIAAPTTGAVPATPGTGSGRSFNSTLGYNTATPDVQLAASGALTGGTLTVNVGLTGGGEPVPTMPPFLGLNYCIAMMGVYPQRS